MTEGDAARPIFANASVMGSQCPDAAKLRRVLDWRVLIDLGLCAEFRRCTP
jgi:hypothetical protein